MKPLFCRDITNDKHNLLMNGMEFCVATLSDMMEEAMDAHDDEELALLKKQELPLALRIAKLVTGFIALTFGLGLLKSLGEVTLTQAYQNASFVFWGCGIALILWAILWLIGKQKMQKAVGSDEEKNHERHGQALHEQIYHELGVPVDAREVDVLTFAYKEQQGKIKPKLSLGMQTPYNNMAYKFFSDADNIYFADEYGKFAIPRTALVAIRRQNGNIILSSWNKETPYDYGEYRRYKLQTNNVGVIVKTQYILEFQWQGEAWGVWFPVYELPGIEAVTGLTCRE